MKAIATASLAGLLMLAGCGGQTKGSAAPKNMTNTNPHPRIEQIQYSNKKAKDVPQSETIHTRRTIDSIGFLEPTDVHKSVKDVIETGRHLSYLALFSYRVKEDGSLYSVQDEQALSAARKTGTAPMMVLTNFTNGNFSPEVAHTIFTNPKVSKRVIQNVLQTMNTKGYKALNIDFEHIKPQDKELYNGFLETIIPKMHKAGYKVSTALAPKTNGTQGGAWHAAHDYKKHGQLADFVILMTYEWGWSGGPPMAVAPIPQVEKVLDYAVSVIPREKIIMGAPLYGYDWKLPYKKGNPFARRIAPQEAEDLAIKKGVHIQFDNEADAPFFYYHDDQGKSHVVWYENDQSAQAKDQLVKKYKLRGIAYWVLGEPFPENWKLLEDQFTIRKH